MEKHSYSSYKLNRKDKRKILPVEKKICLKKNIFVLFFHENTFQNKIKKTKVK
jgi:hypothetical protein